jgi:hypothetical protein
MPADHVRETVCRAQHPVRRPDAFVASTPLIRGPGLEAWAIYLASFLKSAEQAALAGETARRGLVAFLASTPASAAHLDDIANAAISDLECRFEEAATRLQATAGKLASTFNAPGPRAGGLQ